MCLPFDHILAHLKHIQRKKNTITTTSNVQPYNINVIVYEWIRRLLQVNNKIVFTHNPVNSSRF